MRFLFLISILFFLKAALPAQVIYLYPVKVDHKWGYIDKRGKVVVEPKYDAIGDRNLRWHGRSSESPYRLMSVNGKLGLLDGHCREALPAAYDRIFPLGENFFAVLQDSLFCLVNGQGHRLVDGQFEDVTLLDTLEGRFFKIKKAGLWGVYERETGEILPPVYTGIEWVNVGKGYFKIQKPGSKHPPALSGSPISERGKSQRDQPYSAFPIPHSDSLWGLVNRQNRQVLPCQFWSIQCVNDNFFATLSAENAWLTRDSLGRQVMPQAWQNFVALTPCLVALEAPDQPVQLYHCTRRQMLVLAKNYEEFRPLNERYIRCRVGPNSGLIDTSGVEILAPRYLNIRPFNDTLYRVQRTGWGLLSLERGLVLPCEYDSIGEFSGNVCFVKKEGLLGIIGNDWKELVPCAFDRMTLQDSLIKAYDGNNLSIFQVTARGEVLLLDEFASVRTLRIGYRTRHYTEAAVLPPRKRKVRSVLNVEASPFTGMSEDQWQWRRDPTSKRWGLWLKKETTQEQVSPPVFLEALHLRLPLLTLIFTDEQVSVNDATLFPIFPVDTFYRMALFSHREGKFITAFDMLGLRGKDFKQGLPFSAFIDAYGKMGLIDPQGKQAMSPGGTPLRFTYIGDFSEGKARVCLGGKLALTEDGKEEKYGVDNVGNFVLHFGMSTTNAFGSLAERTIFLQKKEGEPLLWGYVDTLGNVVVEPRFDFANSFEDGMAVNQLGGNWGVVDHQNKTLIDFKFSSLSPFHGTWKVGEKVPTRLVFNTDGRERLGAAYRRQGNFSEGLCRVQSDSLWGFMDAEGREVIPCHYDAARDFSEGLAAVRSGNTWSYIDLEGNPAFELKKADQVSDFHSGLAWFKSGYKYGFVDRTGDVKIPAEFTKVFDFRHGVARAVFKGKTGLIDMEGKWLMKPQRFEYISEINEWGVAEAREKYNGKRCLVSTAGEVLTPLKYTHVGEFSEGFAVVADGRLFGLVNRLGEEVLPLEYEGIGQVSEGLVAVRPRYRQAWFYVDTLGGQQFRGEFEVAEPFRQGFAVVQVNAFDPASRFVIDREGNRLSLNAPDVFHFYREGIFGMFNLAGERVNGVQQNYYYADAGGQNLYNRFFQRIEPLTQGTALVRQAYRWGLIDRHGMFLLEPKYPFLTRRDNGELVVNLPLLLGLMGQNGEFILPAAFDRIELMEGGLYRLELGGRVGYAGLDGEWVWEIR